MAGIAWSFGEGEIRQLHAQAMLFFAFSFSQASCGQAIAASPNLVHRALPVPAYPRSPLPGAACGLLALMLCHDIGFIQDLLAVQGATDQVGCISPVASAMLLRGVGMGLIPSASLAVPVLCRHHSAPHISHRLSSATFFARHSNQGERERHDPLIQALSSCSSRLNLHGRRSPTACCSTDPPISALPARQ